MSWIFYGCSSLLLSLPNISNGILIMSIMNSILNGCSSLSSFPDKSKWNINDANDMSYMLYECSSL